MIWPIKMIGFVDGNVCLIMEFVCFSVLYVPSGTRRMLYRPDLPTKWIQFDDLLIEHSWRLGEHISSFFSFFSFFSLFFYNDPCWSIIPLFITAAATAAAVISVNACYESLWITSLNIFQSAIHTHAHTYNNLGMVFCFHSPIYMFRLICFSVPMATNRLGIR